ncbi:MAG: hypothetical protein K0U84_09680 [Actinomycetia bacterium]|nr:hypothetical protein [Actinomycetes bacterium]
MNLDLPTPNIEVDLVTAHYGVTANQGVTPNHGGTANHGVTANHGGTAATYQGCFDLCGAL